ncbi:MAG: hypothetical protein KAS32_17030 [Candidatus Peribacteraceae bacterium]|nr:hypothetical protein [Candidatus Peribacteraceae bacterium]
MNEENKKENYSIRELKIANGVEVNEEYILDGLKQKYSPQEIDVIFEYFNRGYERQVEENKKIPVKNLGLPAKLGSSLNVRDIKNAEMLATVILMRDYMRSDCFSYNHKKIMIKKVKELGLDNGKLLSKKSLVEMARSI